MTLIIYFSRFPVAYGDGGRSLGAPRSHIDRRPRGSATVVSVSPGDLRRRIVLSNYALNPSTLEMSGLAKTVYTHPSDEPEPPLSGSISLGVVLRTAGRNGVFVPIAPLAWLSEGDFRRLDGAVERGVLVGELSSEDVATQLGVEIVEKVRLAGGLGLRLRDPTLDLTYDAIIGGGLRVLRTNVCLHGRLTLTELILLIRSQGNVYLYEPLW